MTGYCDKCGSEAVDIATSNDGTNYCPYCFVSLKPDDLILKSMSCMLNELETRLKADET